MKKTDCAPFVGSIKVLAMLTATSLCSGLAMAKDPIWPDPNDPNKFVNELGKGFDYVFWGFSPPCTKDDLENRIYQGIDIDDENSARPWVGGPDFKLWVQCDRNTSGRLNVDTITPSEKHNLLPQKNSQTDPDRFIFSHREADPNQGSFLNRSNSVLEPFDNHYLRAYVDVVHRNKRTRYLADCPEYACAEVLYTLPASMDNPYQPVGPGQPFGPAPGDIVFP